jgi:hypothetical protein
MPAPGVLDSLTSSAGLFLGYWFVCDACARRLIGRLGQPTCESCLASATLRALADPAMQRRAAEWREERDRQLRWREAAHEDRQRRRLEAEQQRHDERLERRRGHGA